MSAVRHHIAHYKTDRHTQPNYHNPRSACALRVNYIGPGDHFSSLICLCTHICTSHYILHESCNHLHNMHSRTRTQLDGMQHCSDKHCCLNVRILCGYCWLSFTYPSYLDTPGHIPGWSTLAFTHCVSINRGYLDYAWMSTLVHAHSCV